MILIILKKYSLNDLYQKKTCKINTEKILSSNKYSPKFVVFLGMLSSLGAPLTPGVLGPLTPGTLLQGGLTPGSLQHGSMTPGIL